MLKKRFYGIGNYLKRCKHSKKNFTDVIVRHTIVSFFSNIINKKTRADNVVPLL